MIPLDRSLLAIASIALGALGTMFRSPVLYGFEVVALMMAMEVI